MFFYQMARLASSRSQLAPIEPERSAGESGTVNSENPNGWLQKLIPLIYKSLPANV